MNLGLLRSLRTTFIGADPYQGPSAPLRRHWLAAIGVVALVGFAAIVVEWADDRGIPIPLGIGLGALSVAPMLLLRQSPLWAWRVAFVGLLLGPVDNRTDTWPWNPVQIIMMVVVLFVVALREPVGVIVWVGLATIALVPVFANSFNLGGVALVVAAVLVLGEQIQVRRRVQGDLKQQARRSEELTERARLARDLHDVVAHSMSLVAVRAETAPYRLQELPEPVREEFLALAGTARESLTELRRLLGVLRTEAEPALAPQPTLSDLDELIETMRRAGMDIDFHGVPVPPTTALTVYRIVQEGLSNAARHARGARVEVTVTPSVVQVRNGPSDTVAQPTGPGHGLIGMRERVAMLDGRFEAGPTPDGGFVVRVELPDD
ncbi:sensor histidine kinase [Allorhizocola rhizosphaerae]|uniref:sensor histidine kinase n=1 Tax=Allorhizocola rhizosphaerae TaxID=1872709 RepID=UPI000E3BE7E1|nr:sensor histidine kinase [Allorhizocola rhizosphaerae]